MMHGLRYAPQNSIVRENQGVIESRAQFAIPTPKVDTVHHVKPSQATTMAPRI
jgi:hypothetical protein